EALDSGPVAEGTLGKRLEREECCRVVRLSQDRSKGKLKRVLADVRNAEAGIQADIAIHGNIPLVHLRVLEVDGVGRPEGRGGVIVDRHAASAGVRVGPRKNWLAVGADVVELADVRSR